MRRLTFSERTIRVDHVDARKAYGERPSLLVALELDGRTGLGEASPLPGYSPDTLHDARDALSRIAASLNLLPEGPRAALTLIASLAPRSPSARFAAQSAWLDAYAKRVGQPLHRALEPLTARVCAEAVPRSVMVHAIDEADVAVRDGITRLKLKLFGADLTFARAVRARHPNVALRLDANGSLDGADLESLAANVAALAPCLIEEPFTTPRACPFPLALDESLAVAPDEQTRRASLADAVVLKPTTLGVLQCIGLASTKTAIFTHTFEGLVGQSVIAELALSLDAEAVSLHESVAAKIPTLQKTQAVSAAGHVGHGISLESVP